MRYWTARLASAGAVVLLVAACGGSVLGSKLDASAVPVALAWVRADYITFDCARAVALEAPDYDDPQDCRDNRQVARDNRVRSADATGVLHRLCNPRDEVLGTDLPKTDCVRVTVRDVSCGGGMNGHPVVTYGRTVLDVFLRAHGASWRVSAVGTYSADSSPTGRRCPPRG